MPGQLIGHKFTGSGSVIRFGVVVIGIIFPETVLLVLLLDLKRPGLMGCGFIGCTSIYSVNRLDSAILALQQESCLQMSVYI